MATTPGGLPYPVGTDKVVDGDDAIHALATALDPYVAAGGFKSRAADLTVAVGVWGDLSDVLVNYPLRAGVRYRVIGTGSVYVGGAGADVSHRMYVTGGGIGPAQVVLAPLVQKMQLVNQFVFLCGADALAQVSFQAFANNPATGLVLLAGASVSIGVA